jgi:choline monooxygenase
LDGREIGRSILAADTYTDPAVFAAEVGAVFQRRWVWAGFEHWVPTPGSSRPISVAGRPLLLTRDTSGTVRVFHNVCRHRGMVLSEEPSTRKRLRCAYHYWTYEMDGTLCGAPYWDRTKGSAPDDQIRAQLSLRAVRHTTWAGMVLVNLDEAEPATSAEVLLAPLRQRWAPIDLSRLHLADEQRYEIGANWKLVVENFLDFYHLPFVHPQVGPVAAALDIDDVVLSDEILGGCYPRGAAGKARKTETDLPFFGDVPDGLRDRQDIFCVFPNALVFLEADWFQVIGFEPVAVDRTVEHMAVFVDSGAASDEYADARKALCEVLYEVNDQDMPILERLQRGRSSPAADRNHLLPSWDQVTARFQHLVADALEGENDR